jgi:DNA-binding SARP family transcriptional activator/RecA/RadA recombinase
MEFRVLGELEVWSDAGELQALPPQIRAIVCVLVLLSDQGRPVRGDELTRLLSEEGDSQLLRSAISKARRTLTPDRLLGGRSGYRLNLREGDIVDLTQFRDYVNQARLSHQRGDDPAAKDMYVQALDLWHGPPLMDLPATLALEGRRQGLLNERSRARAEMADVRLTLRDHEALVLELYDWVLDDQFNERLWGQLMLALYRCGRRAEALAQYRRISDIFNRDLAASPGRDLRQLRELIESDDLALSSGEVFPGNSSVGNVGGLSPRQLPPDVADFTGRETESEQLRNMLAGAAEASAVSIAQISGPPGVGKTTLAVHVAHQVHSSFPDGQLFLQLAGSSANPRDPGSVLGEILRVLGVPAVDLPDTSQDRAKVYRSLLAGKRVLVVADDAAGPEQIQSLLPGTPGCACIVTSRTQSLHLAGAQLIDLQRLTRLESRNLLANIIGQGRTDADPEATDQVVAACGGFPLAVRIAGARLRSRAAWPLRHLAGLLTRGKPLNELVDGDLEVRAHIAASYALLPERLQRAFRLLALSGPHDFAAWVVAVLLNSGEGEANDIIDELVNRCLLTPVGVDSTGQARYRLHDLLRDFVAEKVSADPEAEPALERLSFAWIDLAGRADSYMPREPYFPPPARSENLFASPELMRRLVDPDPMAWLHAELPNLSIFVETACDYGRFRIAAGLVLRLSCYLHVHNRPDDYENLWRIIARSAEQGGDARLAAEARFRAASVIATNRDLPAQASQLLDGCVETFEALGEWGQRLLARALPLRAYCAQSLERLEDARGDAEKGLGLARAAGDLHAQFSCLRILGLVASQAGSSDKAIDFCSEAVVVARELGDTSYEASALSAVGSARLAAGQYEMLPDLCREGLAITKHHVQAAACFEELWGCSEQGLGDHQMAVTRLARAVTMFEAKGASTAAARSRVRLADSYQQLGLPSEAADQRAQAKKTFELLGRTLGDSWLWR